MGKLIYDFLLNAIPLQDKADGMHSGSVLRLCLNPISTASVLCTSVSALINYR